MEENEFLITKLPSSTTENSIGRSLARKAARTAEYTLGLPGDIANLGLKGANWLIEKASGKPSPLPAEIPFLQTRESIKQNVTEPLAEIFGKSKEYIEPKTENEAFWDNLIGEAGSSFLTTPLSLGRSLAISALGNLAEKGIEYTPLKGTGAETAAKIGGMTIASLLGGRNKIVSNMNKNYEAAREASRGATIKNTSLKSSVNNLKKELNKRAFKGKDFIEARLIDVEKAIKDNNVSIDSLWQLKKDLNQWYPQSYGESKKYLDSLINKIKEPLNEYGKKNPAFGKSFNEAEQAFASLAQSSKIGQFFEKNTKLSNLITNPLLKSILIGGGIYKLGLPTTAALGSVGGTGLLGAREGIKFGSLLAKNPQARALYGKMLKDASLGNINAVGNNIKKLDKVMNSLSDEEEFTITKL